jgi:tetratricopeptide (TPR) repeat protein/SAM-dependent methyltransferase
MIPTDVSSALEHALALCRRGDFATAERAYREITSNHPDVPDAWNMLAVVLQQRGALEDAWDASARAVELRPAIAPYWLVRGNVASESGRHDEAEASYRRACGIDPGLAEAQFRLGLSLHRRCRFDEALAAYAEAQRSAPDVAEIYWQAAEALVSTDRKEAAIAAYEQAFRRDPARTLDRRGAFDCLARCRFDLLPQFWHDEIAAFFERLDIDKGPYAILALKALRTRPSFQAIAAREHVQVDAALARAIADPLFVAVLRDCLVRDEGFERFLTRLRARLVLDASVRERVPLAFLTAFAHQCFANEFVFDESADERSAAEALQRSVEAKLAAGSPADEGLVRDLLAVALYTRLERVAGIDRLLDAREVDPALALLLERTVEDIRTERALREAIVAIVPIEAGVSEAVRSMYEEHPYPRWFSLDRDPPISLPEWFSRELPTVPAPPMPASARLLVAGCGTGRDALWLASNIEGARVLGVDLSRSSLAHGTRMAARLGIGNVEFRNGDILNLAAVPERFDFIASTGVLHHMREPLAGLRVLSTLLAKNGLMKLGFYSERARHAVTAAREIIAAEGIPATEPEMRRFRRRVLDAPPDSPLYELRYAPDLYSTSMCRDLVFHVQEHQYTLPRLAEMLHACGLEFLRLSELPPEALGRYLEMFPGDATMNDIGRWDALERRYPDTFSRMFLFWCRAA